MRYVVNGRTVAGWRIDDMEREASGPMDFLANPVAIVPDRAMADRICEKLNAKSAAISDVVAERGRQDAKWGEQNHGMADYLAILVEEVGEAAKAIVQHTFEGAPADPIRHELVHSAAVAVAMIEAFDRKKMAEVGK